MRVLVVHHSKYGNGKQIAGAIAEGLVEAGHKAEVVNAADVKSQDLNKYDAFVIGSPTHAGGPTFKCTGAIKRIGKARPGKPFVIFATNINPNATTVQKLDAKAEKCGLRKLMDGKFFRVTGMKGPLEGGAVDAATAFGKEIGERLTRP